MEPDIPCEKLMQYLQENIEIRTDKKKLVVLFGQLGDFDSFEYAQYINKSIPELTSANIQIILIAIGNSRSKKLFCEYTNLPEDLIYVVGDNSLHKSLKLYAGPFPNTPPMLHLIAMCAGIGSRGTIAEVVRGYLGDTNAAQLINSNESIKIKGFPEFHGRLFDFIDKSGHQRPFELATIRLRNMMEVISNWRSYFFVDKYITQLGATILFSPDNRVLYQYKNKGILCFCENRSNPLEFLMPHSK